MVPDFDVLFRQACARFLKRAPLAFPSDFSLDMENHYERPDEVGADRLLAAGKKVTVKPLEKPAVTPVAAEDAPAAPMADAPKTTGSEMDLDIMADE